MLTKKDVELLLSVFGTKEDLHLLEERLEVKWDEKFRRMMSLMESSYGEIKLLREEFAGFLHHYEEANLEKRVDRIEKHLGLA